MTADPLTDLYLRLSDFRDEDDTTFEDRKARLTTLADQIGWEVHQIIIENDLIPDNGGMKRKPASAWKRKKIRLPNGQWALRTVRPGFRDVLLPDVMNGINLIAEDLDRLLRQPRDGEDLLDAVEMSGASARSLSGSLTLTDGGTDAERMTARIMAAVANKSSSDTARRVAWGRERWAGKSYQGGRRPYGYQVKPGTKEHERNLVTDPAEEKVIVQAAADILDRDISLKAITRDLRDRRVPTVTGAQWNTRTLRDVLLKPAVAGQASYRGELRPAPWPAILERDVQDRLRDKLTDPARRTNKSRANEPRWLVSVFATCGVCARHVKVGGAGRGRGPAYVGAECGHVRRAAGTGSLDGDPAGVDDLIAQLAVARLSQPDAADLLKPAPRPGIDAKRLRTEARKLRDRKTAQMRMHAAGDLDDADLVTGMRAIRDRLATIDKQLAASDQPDPLAEFRGRPAAEVWTELSTARRRAVVQALIESVIIQPSGRRGSGFHPDTVEITWRQ